MGEILFLYVVNSFYFSNNHRDCWISKKEKHKYFLFACRYRDSFIYAG